VKEDITFFKVEKDTTGPFEGGQRRMEKALP
jgi:hypothetical protein